MDNFTLAVVIGDLVTLLAFGLLMAMDKKALKPIPVDEPIKPSTRKRPA